ncbi:hypothetical protein [Pleomorphovibrio marinus]|uniref:hypothetical protein n=1 Tax=Pleomorphovibrio marinus TaxID=2164132 RepID=UPI0013009159|nr:hypothetical protein [Pleomorphovibrio marinus]
MWKLLKIFGIASFSFVFLLSFFNERRADNTGDRDEFSITDASRIYFQNVRSAYYDMENRRDAKMNLYRFGKRVEDSTQNVLNVTLIVNAPKDAAYLYLEPMGILQKENPLKVKWQVEGGKTGDSQFYQGDRYSHYHFVKEVYPWLITTEETKFWAFVDEEWIPLFVTQKEINAFLTPCKDFFRLVGEEN